MWEKKLQHLDFSKKVHSVDSDAIFKEAQKPERIVFARNQVIQGSLEKIGIIFLSNLTSEMKKIHSERRLNHPTMNVANTQIQMRKGLLEFCVLHIISRGEVYTSDLIDELTQAQMIVVEGTLYPLLNRLKSAELVTYRWVESEAGPPRKYYSITEEGKNFLLTLSDTWASLVNSTNEITSKN